MKGCIPACFAPVLFGAMLSLIMVSIISAVVLFVTQGMTPDFATRWLKSFLSTWPVAFPSVLIIAPVVRKCVTYLTASN